MGGRHETEIAAEFGATRTGTPGEDHYGWLNLPVREAYAKAVALNDRRKTGSDRKFAFDLRPHSHHWRVMADVRASENEAASIDVGGALIMFAMTSVGDGFFPVHVELDAAGALTAAALAAKGLFGPVPAPSDVSSAAGPRGRRLPPLRAAASSDRS